MRDKCLTNATVDAILVVGALTLLFISTSPILSNDIMNKEYYKVNYKVLQTESVSVDGEQVKVSFTARVLYCHLLDNCKGFPLDYEQKEYAQHLGLGIQIIRRDLATLERIGAISRELSGRCNHAITVLSFPAPFQASKLVDVPEETESFTEAVEEPQAAELHTITLPEVTAPVEAPVSPYDLVKDTTQLTFFDVVDYIGDNAFYKWSGETVTEFVARMLEELDKDKNDAAKLVRYIKESKPELFEELNEPF